MEGRGMPKPGLAQSGQWDGRGRWRPAMRRGDFHSGLTLRNRHFLPARLPCGAGVIMLPGPTLRTRDMCCVTAHGAGAAGRSAISRRCRHRPLPWNSLERNIVQDRKKVKHQERGRLNLRLSFDCWASASDGILWLTLLSTNEAGLLRALSLLILGRQLSTKGNKLWLQWSYIHFFLPGISNDNKVSEVQQL